jgi:hypothetical protein
MSLLSKQIRRSLSKKDPSSFIEIGDRFGDLEVMSIGEKRGTSRHIHYNCKCVCGREVVVPSYRLKSGATRSCGCSKVKHGHTSRIFKGGTEVYKRYVEMHRRCEEKGHRGYERYGAKGIKVCDRWSGENGFEHFFADMGPCPPGYQLDRIDGTKGYSPDNCRYASLKTQNRNRSDNIWIEYKGLRQILQDWGTAFGVSGNFISRRLKKGLSMREIEELADLHNLYKKDKKYVFKRGTN